jgi:hypothetical protein
MVLFAQAILKNLIMNLPAFVAPNSDDLKGWQEMNERISSIFSQMSEPIVNN